MNRDAIIATIIGFIIGLLITSLLLFGPRIFKNLPNIKLPDIKIEFPNLSKISPGQTGKSQSETEKDTINQKNTISFPENEALLSDKDITLTGKTEAGSQVLISTDEKDILAETDSKGSFKAELSLNEGQNILHVLFTNNKSQELKNITVYYTPETF